MAKTIYICLMTLFFSVSAFADGPFDEYGGTDNYGNYGQGTWTTITIVSGGGYVYSVPVYSTGTVIGPGSSPNVSGVSIPATNYYVGTGGTTTQTAWKDAKSILQYQYRSGDVVQILDLYRDLSGTTLKLDSNGNVQHGFIITSNYGSTAVPITSYSLLQANSIMLNSFTTEASRPNFSYNSYNPVNNTVTENIYKPTPEGPVVVRAKTLRAYSEIPRVVKANPNFAPDSPFFIGSSILNNGTPQLSLYDAYRIIRDHLDYAKPDDVLPANNGIGLREKEILERVLPRVRERLPADLKPDAESVLAMYIQQCDENPDIHPAILMDELLNSQKVDEVALSANLPFVEGKNYVFDSNGNPKEAGAAGDLVQIEVNGVKKLPSELNVNDLAQKKALSKVAVFLAKKQGAPVGSWFSTGLKDELSSINPAFTMPYKPYISVLNRKGGSYSTSLDNIYSFTNIVYHELLHQGNMKAGIVSNLSNHADVYINSFSHVYFAKSPDSYKLSVIKSLANYILNMDRNTKNIYQPYKTKEKIDNFNNLHLRYKFVVPITYKRGELTISIKDTQILEDATPFNFTLIKDEN